MNFLRKMTRRLAGVTPVEPPVHGDGSVVALSEEQKEIVMRGLMDFRNRFMGLECSWEVGSVFELDGVRMTVARLYANEIPTHVWIG
jgi:hypothetical protein